jgi:hypothetical protein
VRERALDVSRARDQGLDMATDHYENDERQATLSIVLLAIMSVIITGLIVMSVLSMRACTV